MSSFFDNALQSETLASVRARIIAFAQAANLQITSWLQGDIGEQIFESTSQLAYLYTAMVARVVRGYASLDTSTDPGDVDAYDANNVNLDPAPGFLSNLGASSYGTTREGETFATGFWTLHNAGPGVRVFKPGALVFTWTGGSPPSPAPTYRNAPDSTIYTNPDGTVTVGVAASVILPIVAEEIGIRSNAPPSTITLTTTLVGVTGSNAASVLAIAREPRDIYIDRCRQSMSRLSLGGPSDAYKYLAAKDINGNPLINANGDASNITKVYVSSDSSTGNVDLYFASSSGAAISDDVDAANTNILLEAFVDADALNIGPGFPGGIAATEVSIHVVGTAKIRKRDAALGATAIKQKIVDALTAAFELDEFNPVGGVDQTSGAGFIYTTDIRSTAAAAFPGLYDVLVTTPGGASTAIALGHIATLNTVVGDWTLTIV